jgi:hypothetical protein
MSTNESGDTAIQDKLWLPTEWELFQNGSGSISDTVANQARLEYYTDNNSRVKRQSDDTAPREYWAANEDMRISYFRVIGPDPDNGCYSFCFSSACIAEGCVPAFCIK